MATNAIGGFKATLRVSSDGVTYYKLAELVDLNPAVTMNPISASHHDSLFNEKIAGKRDWSVTGTHNYIYNDTAWTILRDACISGVTARVYVKIIPFEEIGRENIFTSKTPALRAVYRKLDYDICRKCQQHVFVECARMGKQEPLEDEKPGPVTATSR